MSFARKNQHLRFDDDGHILEEQPQEQEEEPLCQFVARKTRMVMQTDNSAVTVWYPFDGTRTYQVRIEYADYPEENEYLSFPNLCRKSQAEMIFTVMKRIFRSDECVYYTVQRYDNAEESERYFPVFERHMSFSQLSRRTFREDLKLMRTMN